MDGHSFVNINPDQAVSPFDFSFFVQAVLFHCFQHVLFPRYDVFTTLRSPPFFNELDGEVVVCKVDALDVSGHSKEKLGFDVLDRSRLENGVAWLDGQTET